MDTTVTTPQLIETVEEPPLNCDALQIQNAQTGFLLLPPEVKLMITSHLDFHDLVSLSETCRDWHTFLMRDYPSAWHYKNPPKWGRSYLGLPNPYKPKYTPPREEVFDMLENSTYRLLVTDPNAMWGQRR